MEWNDKLQLIIDDVEEHLQRKEEPINVQEIERIAGCSYSFFQKVFSYMNNISFSDYIRFRKLTLAGYDLKSSSIKIVDLSYKYGYDSPTSFTKAFEKFHGISPSMARKENQELKVYPKMQITFQQKYSWKIEEKQEMRLVGKRIRISCINNEHYQKIPEFWNQCQRDGTFSHLISLDTNQPKGIFGLFEDYDQESQEIIYAIMVISHQALPKNYHEIIVPASFWAIFDCRGMPPQSIQDGWKYLNQEWLIKYPFQHARAPELEWYSDGNAFDQDYLSQIWIPILKEE